MGHIHFSHKESSEIWKLLEEAKYSKDSRQIFNDWLTMIICALSGGEMEDEYMKTIEPYTDGEKGKRGVDYLAQAFGELVNAMEETKADILGDIYQGAVTFGEHGQYYTPEHITDLMAQITGGNDGERVYDPCCGSGRMLLSSAKENPHRYFFGQDIDERCVKMTAINLALNGLNGQVVLGDALTFEEDRVYLCGFNGKGVIRVQEGRGRSEVPSTPEPEGEQMQMFAA